MKKISLILMGVFGLLFSPSVYADSGIKVAPFDYFYVTDSDFVDNDEDSGVVSFYKGQIWKVFPYYGDNNIGDFYLTALNSPFGHYSDGSTIQYYKTSQVYDIADWMRNLHYYVDNNNEVHTELSITNTRRIDFSHIGWACNYQGYCSDSSLNSDVFRIDFAVKVNFHDSNYNSLKNDLTDKLFDGIRVPEISLSRDSCNYDTYKDSYIINITCSGTVKKTFNWSLEFVNLNDYTVLTESNYSIRADFYFSEASLVSNSSGLTEDLIMDNSPNGDSFNDYYRHVEVKSDNYFSNFGDLNLNGLTQIVLSPLAFIRSLSSPYFDTQYNSSNRYSCVSDPLHKNISIFNHSICIPSGAIFWNRGRDIMSYNKEIMLMQFRQVWNILFGGYIIYFLCMKLYKTSIRSFDPDSSDEVTTL